MLRLNIQGDNFCQISNLTLPHVFLDSDIRKPYTSRCTKAFMLLDMGKELRKGKGKSFLFFMFFYTEQ